MRVLDNVVTYATPGFGSLDGRSGSRGQVLPGEDEKVLGSEARAARANVPVRVLLLDSKRRLALDDRFGDCPITVSAHLSGSRR